MTSSRERRSVAAPELGFSGSWSLNTSNSGLPITSSRRVMVTRKRSSLLATMVYSASAATIR